MNPEYFCTNAERILGTELRARGVSFQPNCPVRCNGRTFTPDFLIGKKLVVEILGGIHWKNDVRTKDIIRRMAFEASGFTILEFLNEEVVHNIKRVASTIEFELSRTA
ncbi:MAG: DUF559 domain-containing protein [Thaumarchaeota archaeon]|nr:DUF559 domain-containing protein [Nitrososphaerota archaeon]